MLLSFKVAFFIKDSSLGKYRYYGESLDRTISIFDWCCMCKLSGETTDHLLLHCDRVWLMVNGVAFLACNRSCWEGLWSCWSVGVGGLGRHYAVDVLRHAELCSVSVDHLRERTSVLLMGLSIHLGAKISSFTYHVCLVCCL